MTSTLTRTRTRDTRVTRAIAVIAFVLLAQCRGAELEAPEPEVPFVPVVTTIEIRATNSISAVRPMPLYAYAFDQKHQPMANRAAVWSKTGGTFDSSFITPNTTAEGWAVILWQSPTLAGQYDLSVKIDSITATKRITVTPDFVGFVTLVPDSVRFTRLGKQTVKVTATDWYGNPTPVSAYNVLGSITSPFKVTLAGDSAVIETTSAVNTLKLQSELRFNSFSDNSVIGKVKVVLDLVVASTTITTTAVQLTPTDTAQLSVQARDSSNNVLNVPLSAAGITLSSSDNSVVVVDTLRRVFAQAPGSANVTARWNGNDVGSIPISVLPLLDLGARLALYNVPNMDLYVWPQSPRFDDNGLSVFEVDYPGHSGNGFASWKTLRFYTATGMLTTTRTISYAAAVVVEPSGRTVVSTPLFVYNTAGYPIWTANDSGTAVQADSTQVVLASDARLRAYDAVGNVVWTRSLLGSSTIGMLLARERIYLAKNGELQTFDRAGQPLWSVPTVGNFHLLATDDSSALYAQIGTSLVSFDKNTGAQSWSLPGVGNSPKVALAPDNALVVSTGASLMSLDRGTGAARWTVVTQPTAVSVSGTTVFAIERLKLIARRLSDGAIIGMKRGNVAYNSPISCTRSGLDIVDGNQFAVLFERCQ